MADTILNRTVQENGTGEPSGGNSHGGPAPPGQQPGPRTAGADAEASVTVGTATPRSRQPSPRPGLRVSGMALLLLAALVLGFAGYLYGLSGVQEARSQRVLLTQLGSELSGQLAPLGWKTPGRGVTASSAPVALLDIPSIGIRDMVVVQGTSPQNLMLGPGHRLDTPFPGQPGVSEIFGRRATFGAPFARLGQLRPGDKIRVVTGEGWSTYVVAAVASSTQVIKDPVANRLLLLTASSPVTPSYYLTVDARLISSMHGSPGVAPVITSSALPLAGDLSALAVTTAMEWGLMLALACTGATFAALRWSPWGTYLVAAPVILAVLWNLYQSLAALLPNLY